MNHGTVAVALVQRQVMIIQGMQSYLISRDLPSDA